LLRVGHTAGFGKRGPTVIDLILLPGQSFGYTDKVMQSDTPILRGQGNNKVPFRVQLLKVPSIKTLLFRKPPFIFLHSGGQVGMIAKIKAIIEHFKKLVGTY